MYILFYILDLCLRNCNFQLNLILIYLSSLYSYCSQSISAGILRLTPTRNCVGRVHLWDNTTYLLSISVILVIQYILVYILYLRLGSCKFKLNLLLTYLSSFTHCCSQSISAGILRLTHTGIMPVENTYETTPRT